ncbi:hypothetical protein PtA15_6A631 [Puccinia triticina]|uniref:DNA repair protein RAD5 n=1 Tax=Puccinia triticina TaxID=208348 RepID=A0ABY7CL93_9BASI|nr:uncharacterized protein PtA15_6A631 [Puccinia triticina]WAQ86001.1 hypothetical protein PtA15_6A631 [Puccinia triticina]WAR55898.1 hypothetical protein PtB15_6B642 [Puccinia triticina]
MAESLEGLDRLSPDASFFDATVNKTEGTPEQSSIKEEVAVDQITLNGTTSENFAKDSTPVAVVTPSKRPRFFRSPSPDNKVATSPPKSGHRAVLAESNQQTVDPRTPTRSKDDTHRSSSKHTPLSPLSPRLNKKSKIANSPDSSITSIKKDSSTDGVENKRPSDSQDKSTCQASDEAQKLRVDQPLFENVSDPSGKSQAAVLDCKPDHDAHDIPQTKILKLDPEEIEMSQPAIHKPVAHDRATHQPANLKSDPDRQNIPQPAGLDRKPDLSSRVPAPSSSAASDNKCKTEPTPSTDNTQSRTVLPQSEASMDEDRKPNLSSRSDVKPDPQTWTSSSNYIDLSSSPDPPDFSSVSKKIKPEYSGSSRPPAPRASKGALPSWERKYIGGFMCEGYLIYSSARLREGESVWLSRSSANEVKKTSKSVSAKKEDHVVRLESKNNGAFARLNENFAKWIVKLIDQRLIIFEGKMMFPPSKCSIGATVHCYLKAYLLRSAFVSPTDKKFDSLTNLQKSKLANFFNAPEAKEDKERMDRQRSVNHLFSTINLIASISSPASARSGSRPNISSFKTAGSVKTDPDTEGVIDQQSIDQVYQKATAHDMSLDLRSPCDGFELPLRPYQQQGLGWLMKMEVTLEDAREEVSIHPLWEEYLFPHDEDQAHQINGPDEQFYYNPYMGEFSFEFPRASRKCQGGILADEMGLGKTIQMAALICTARPPNHPLLKPANDDDQWYDSDKKPKIKAEQEASGWESSPLQQGPTKRNLLRKSHATLVVCPLTLLDQWKDELERCHKALKVFVYHSASKAALSGAADQYDVVITTYNIVASEWATIDSKSSEIPKLHGLFKVDWYRIILDEGHNIKNPKAQSSKACYNLSGRRRWVLSGTPIVNRLEDLSSLLHFIRLEPWGDFSFYRSFVTVPFSKKDPKALVVVQTIIESVLLRREKKMKDLNGEPIVSLPPKHINLAYLELNRKERTIYDMIYNNAKSEYMEYLGQGTVMSHVTAILAILMRLRQAVLHPSLVLKKIKWSKGQSDDDAKTIGNIMKDYENSTDSSFAANQWKDLEKRLKGKKGDGEVEEQECVMCLDVMDSRVFLPCMHAFCKECIMSYIENKAGEETTCPTCEVAFQETGIVEFVMNRSKNSSQPSSGVSTPGGLSSAAMSEDEAPEMDTKPIDKSQIGSKSSRGMIDLDYQLPIESIPKSRSDDEDDEIGGGYLKRNDFISSTKLEALTDHLIRARREDPGFSAVVFSQFTGFLDLIEQVLKRDKFRFVRLDGTLPSRKRKKALETFNDPRKPCILVCSLKVAGVGLNLIKANRVYMMDTWWNEAIENQAIDRIHRFGQDKPTYVVRFLVSNSIEDRMLSIQKKKRAIINDALGGNKNSKATQAQTLENFQAIFAD